MEDRYQFKVTKLKDRVFVKILFIKCNFKLIFNGENLYKTVTFIAVIIIWNKEKR